MKKLIQVLLLIGTMTLVFAACEPVEVDEDFELDDPMMEEEQGEQ
ncbi:MAG: hypothetical protein ACLFNQ_07770 [Spirochaetaceae bacterium]